MKKLKFLGMLFLALTVSFTACKNDPEEPDFPDPEPTGSDIYTETFGNAATESPWPAIGNYTGFQKTGAGSAAVTYTSEGGTVSVRGNSVSNYTNASGACNAMMAAAGASLIINDIATCGATNLILSFGSNQMSDTLAVLYKVNGTTNWIPISYTKSTTTWGHVSNVKVTLAAGTNTIKLKFVAGRTQFGTRVDDIKIITTDQVGSPVIDPDGDDGGENGNGTEASPYNILGAQSNQGSKDNTDYKWVKGYIVGIWEGKNAAGEDIYPNNFAKFEPPFYTDVNILLAASASETDPAKVICVQLPVGEIRNALNLVDNSSILKKEVLLCGALESYNSMPGMKSTQYFDLEGKTGGTKPGTGGPVIFSETFETGQGNFSIVNVLMNDPVTYVWTYDANFKQMKAGAYVGGVNYATEGWLISPAIDLSGKTSATFTFEHAGKQFGAPVDNLTIQVSTVYAGGDINAADWTKLTIPNHLAGETNTFKSAGDIDLTPYCGQSNVRIAFKYTSTTTGAGNWYVRNVVVK